MYINLAFDFASSHAFAGSRCGLSFIMFSLILFANGFSIVCHLNFSSSCFLCKIVTSFAMFTLFLVLALIVDWRQSINPIHSTGFSQFSQSLTCFIETRSVRLYMLSQPPQTRHGIIVVFVYTSLSCVDTFRVVPQLGCLDYVPLLLQPPD